MTYGTKWFLISNFILNDIYIKLELQNNVAKYHICVMLSEVSQSWFISEFIHEISANRKLRYTQSNNKKEKEKISW